MELEPLTDRTPKMKNQNNIFLKKILYNVDIDLFQIKSIVLVAERYLSCHRDFRVTHDSGCNSHR